MKMAQKKRLKILGSVTFSFPKLIGFFFNMEWKHVSAVFYKMCPGFYSCPMAGSSLDLQKLFQDVFSEISKYPLDKSCQ